MAPCDYRKYPKDWRRIRAAVLERAHDKCEECGVANYAIVTRNPKEDRDWDIALQEEDGAVKIILTIAHLNHDTTDNRMENLKALCQLHHNRYDVEHRKGTRAETLKAKREAPLFDGKGK